MVIGGCIGRRPIPHAIRNMARRHDTMRVNRQGNANSNANGCAYKRRPLACAPVRLCACALWCRTLISGYADADADAGAEPQTARYADAQDGGSVRP